MEFTTRGKAKKQTGVNYLGNINSSAKLIKNEKVSENYTYVIYLSPANQSGYNVCPFSTPECRLGCLATSGRAKIERWANMDVIQKARLIKTKLLFENEEFFMRLMVAEMKAYQKKAKLDGYYFSARLNGTSDIDWETIKIDGKNIFEIFPEVQFYDYTKSYKKIVDNRVKNYHLTYSYTGRNTAKCIKVLRAKKNIAIIFNIPKNQAYPKTWNGFKVINGDRTDFRPYEGDGVVVGLKWKNIADRKMNETIRASCFVEQVVSLKISKFV